MAQWLERWTQQFRENIQSTSWKEFKGDNIRALAEKNVRGQLALGVHGHWAGEHLVSIRANFRKRLHETRTGDSHDGPSPTTHRPRG